MSEPNRPPVNWPASLMLSLTAVPVLFVLPWYLWNFDASGAAWAWGAVLLAANGLSITAGYHCLWAHRTYKAQPLLKWLFAIFGGMAVQNSILIWATAHRVHHRHVDDVDRDPYSAKRGFWYSHIGWMLRDYPAATPDFSRAPDLLADPVVMFQHRHYNWFAFGTNFGLVPLLGLLHGDLAGFVLVAGFLRLFLSHHFTFFINSLAHLWGRRPYTGENTARDNDLLALFTWGEGYHNFHHLFQYDYRNGIRWWQFDPTKWLIAGAARLGLAGELKRVPEVKIQQARVARQFELARTRLEELPLSERLEQIREQLDTEWQQFSDTVARWTELQAGRIEAARQQLRDRWEGSELKHQVDAMSIAHELRMQRLRVRVIERELLSA